MRESRLKKLIRQTLAGFGLTVLLLAPTVALAQSNDGGSTVEKAALTPELSIDIPEVKFSDVTAQDGRYGIPWIAEYISGVFRYAVAIGVFLAGAMIMVGGLIYLTSGDSSRTMRAKTLITDSLLGLGVILGAFVLLNTINPELTTVRDIEIVVAEPDVFSASLGTTEIDTIGTGGPGYAPGLGSGQHTTSFPNCPFPLPTKTSSKPWEDERAQAFFKLAKGITGSGSRIERIKAAADLAAVCDVSLGSCGSSVGYVNILAGMRDSSALEKSQGGSWVKGGTAKNINSDLRREVPGVRCKTAEQMAKLSSSEHNYWRGNLPNCQATGKGARALLMQKIREKEGDGYPDDWAVTLKPGDTLVIYNGNGSYMASHSVIFLGWADNGMAQIFQGSYGKSVNLARTCITSKCGDPRPIVSISRP